MPLLVEMGWGGLILAPTTITWTDITDYVDVVQGVAITRGASDELSETQPGTATLTLDNSDGRFTPGNTGSPYYPYVRQNVPIRVSAAVIPQRSGAAPYPLAMLGDDFDNPRVNTSLWTNIYGGASQTNGRARVPASPTGGAGFQTSREWRLQGSKVTARLITVPGANGSSSATAGIYLHSNTVGTRIGWRLNAVTGLLWAENQVGYNDSFAVSVAAPYERLWLRIRESGGTVYWETSRDGFGWTVRRTLATPVWVATDSVVVEMTASRSGGVADFIEWDLVGAAVKPRFWGTVNEWPVEWSGLYSKVQISATDLFKRLNKLPQLRSMVGEEILVGRPLVYYPLTEGDASTSAGDLSGTSAPALPVVQAGAAGSGTLALGSAEGPAETGEQVAEFTPVSSTAGKYLTADLGPALRSFMGLYTAVELWFQTTVTGRVMWGFHTPDLSLQTALALNASGGVQLEWISDGSTFISVPTGGPTGLADGKWHHVAYDELAHTMRIDGVVVDSAMYVPFTFDQQVLHIGGYRNTRLWSGSIGHVAMFSGDVSFGPSQATRYDAGMNGHAGESADTRMLRLAYYAGLTAITVWGDTHDPMASQGPAGTTAMARMREVETTESARLYAERDWFGLAYQSRDVRYNPSSDAETFTIAYADLEPGVSLANDDQKLVNQVEAARPNGATQRVSSTSSIDAFGLYPQSLTVLKTSDNSVLDAAAWLISRFADPGVELRRVPIEAATMPNYLDILDADISSYFTVYGLPAQAPSAELRVTVEGYSETIKHNSHVIEFNTSNSARDSVWILDDPDYSQLDQTTRLAY
ncbi:hypothetical protein [Streptomyces sp. BH055]|uniref:hypothetical protein n=1 Tax=Streptomyces sp. BH055 TaxID=3401173 RepID=UPI003BB79C90